jgi:hypothetical protein
MGNEPVLPSRVTGCGEVEGNAEISVEGCEIMFVDRIYQNTWIGNSTLEKIDPILPNAINEKFNALPLNEKEEISKKLKKHLKLLNKLIEDDGVLRLSESANINDSEQEKIKEKIKKAQKFLLTTDFSDASLEKLATQETIVKCKDMIKLPHNPMFIEWKIIHEKAADFHVGSLLWKEEEKEFIEGIFFDGLRGMYEFNNFVFFPTTLELDNDGDIKIMVKEKDNHIIEAHWTNEGNGKFYEVCVPHIIDFLVRINSEKIAEITACENLDRINKKRTKNGKLPNFEYHIVDLNKNIKKDLEFMKKMESDSHLRLHWRRGHFKCRKTGVFWWNPHLAGREELGKIEKHYEA